MGVIFLAVLLFFCARSIFETKTIDDTLKILFISSICCAVFLDVGYVFKISNFEFTYSKLSLSLFGLISLIKLFYRREFVAYLYKKRFLILLFVLLIVSIVIGYINILHISPCRIKILPTFQSLDAAFRNNELLQCPFVDYYAVKASIMMLLWMGAAYLGTDYFRERNFVRALILGILIGFTVVFGVQIIEFVYNYFVGDFFMRKVINTFVGVGDSTVSQFAFRFGVKNAYSLFKEPSHFGFVLIILYSLFYVLQISGKTYYQRYFALLILYSIIGSLISGSTTSVIVCFIGLLLVFIAMIQTRQYKAIAFIVGVAVLFLILVFATDLSIFADVKHKLLSSIGKGGKSKLGQARNFGIILCYQALLKYPLFGVGLGVTKSTGLLSTMAANLGFVGLSLYFIVLKNVMSLKIRKINFPVFVTILFVINFAFPYGTFYSPFIFAIFLPLSQVITGNEASECGILEKLKMKIFREE